MCIRLSLKLLFGSPKAALWHMPRWQDLWQAARWQDLQLCGMLHFIKTTKVCGWAEQRAGVLTAYCFHFLFSVWALLTPPRFKEKCPRRGLYYEILIYMLNVLHQICFPTCWNWFRTQCSPPFYLCGAACLHIVGEGRGHPQRAAQRENVPLTVPNPAEGPGCCIAASGCLALPCSLCKLVNRMIRAWGQFFHVHVCSSYSLAKRFRAICKPAQYFQTKHEAVITISICVLQFNWSGLWVSRWWELLLNPQY